MTDYLTNLPMVFVKKFAGDRQFLCDHNINYHALAAITCINEDISFELA